MELPATGRAGGIAEALSAREQQGHHHLPRTLGIEGRKLLHLKDEFNPVRELNEQFDGTLSALEKLRLNTTTCCVTTRTSPPNYPACR
ncbi:MAG: hypothetical protein IPN44_11505 [Flavobacteriales bacterium]|nr:hypothetical protein [Flavobacteriales bacterium]